MWPASVLTIERTSASTCRCQHCAIFDCADCVGEGSHGFRHARGPGAGRQAGAALHGCHSPTHALCFRPSGRLWPPGSQQDSCVPNRMQKGTVTKKNSLARNVHRLRTVVVFTEKIMANLIRDAAMSLSGAVSAAYGDTLAPYHSTIVRTTCNAGFLLLPSRHSFLQSIGETGKDSRMCFRLAQYGQWICQAVNRLISNVGPSHATADRVDVRRLRYKGQWYVLQRRPLSCPQKPSFQLLKPSYKALTSCMMVPCQHRQAGSDHHAAVSMRP
jgi:Glycolipid transfer protein (GLTP)